MTLPLPDPAAYPDEPREYAMALMQRKEEIEKAMVSHSGCVRRQAHDRMLCGTCSLRLVGDTRRLP